MKSLEVILYNRYKKGTDYEYVNYDDEIESRLAEIPRENQSRTEAIKACCFKKLDVKLISEKNELLSSKNKGYFNTEVFQDT